MSRHALVSVILGFAALLIGMRPAAAQEPMVHGLPHVAVPDTVVRTVLSNGLTVLVVEDHSSPIVDAEMLFRVGQVDEDDSNAGITNLIQNILVKRISKAGGKDDPYYIESRGSILNASANPDYADISLLTEHKDFPELFSAIAGAVARRSFDKKEVDEERSKEVSFLEGDQRVFKAIYEIFLEQFYRYHPYRQPQDGSAGSVRQLTTAKLDAFYQHYWAPNNTVVAVVGDVDRDQVVKMLREKLGKLAQVPDKRIEVSWEPKAVEKELYLSSGSNLAWIFLGYPAPGLNSPDYMPMDVLHTILGDGLSSRIWVDLREKHGLAYELGSIFPELEGPSHMIQYVVTPPAHLRESQRRLFNEIKRIRTQPVSSEELENAKRRLIGAYLLERESDKGRAFNLGLAELLAGGYQYDLQTIDRIKRVTQDDVLRVAKAYLKDYTLVVARPRGIYFY